MRTIWLYKKEQYKNNSIPEGEGNKQPIQTIVDNNSPHLWNSYILKFKNQTEHLIISVQKFCATFELEESLIWPNSEQEHLYLKAF